MHEDLNNTPKNISVLLLLKQAKIKSKEYY